MKSFKQIDAMEECIINALGESGALEAITAALDYDVKEEIYDYIIRNYDLEDEEWINFKKFFWNILTKDIKLIILYTINKE